MAVLLVVLLYGGMVVTDLALGNLASDEWRISVKWADGVFLAFFVVEISLRLVAFGVSYLRNFLNLVDAFAVFASIAFFSVQLTTDVAEDGDDEDDGAVGDAANIVPMLRLLRVVRLVAVLLRSINTTQSMVHSRQKRRSSCGSEVPGLGRTGSFSAQQAEIEDWIYTEWAVEPPTEQEIAGFQRLSAYPALVHLLSASFPSLLATIRRLDKDGDGQLSCEEMLPMLRRIGMSEKDARTLFEIIDIDKSGDIGVTELYKAHAWLVQEGDTIEFSQDVSQDDASVGDESFADSVAGGQTRAHRVRAQLHATWTTIQTKADWVFHGRWHSQASRDLNTLLHRSAVERVSRSTRASSSRMSSRAANRPYYAYAPGPVDNLGKFMSGTGALVESRCAEIAEQIYQSEREVGELLQKLQEIEVSQPREVRKIPSRHNTYRTFLQCSAKALECALQRVECFASSASSDMAVGWRQMRPGHGSEGRVNKGALAISVSLTVSLVLRWIFLGVYLKVKVDGRTAYDLQRACEQGWAFNTTSEQFMDPALLDATEEPPMPPECASGEGALVVARLAILPPLLSLISLLWAPMIFFGNTNPSALNQLLREPRVLLIMGQVTLRSGMVAVSTSSFPVAFELYSLPSGGISLFAATLIDCLFLPCAIIMFVSLDCAIVPAPRARCVLAFHFLYLLLLRGGIAVFSELPSVLETHEDSITAMIYKIDFSLLMMMLGSILKTLRDPRMLVFVQINTDLVEFVLFDTATRKLKQKQQLVARMQHQK